jgi:ubiquinone/menaquinone biosynthesis C-methylase UbiE
LDPVDYDKHQSKVYARGRALAPEMLADWMSAFARHAPADRPLSVLDLGSGTGRFTPGLAETFGGPVHGVEPSFGMRQAALADARHPAVTYLAGSADAIPLPDTSVDLVLLYLVWHHVPDRAAAAAEIRRVLRPGGRVLIRSTFGNRLPESSWRDYFPRATELEAVIFPSTMQVEEEFSMAGLRRVALEVVRIQAAEDYAAYAERLHMKAISIFEHLTEEEIEHGFARLDADVAAGHAKFRLAEDGDLLVLELPARTEAGPGPVSRGRVRPRSQRYSSVGGATVPSHRASQLAGGRADRRVPDVHARRHAGRAGLHPLLPAPPTPPGGRAVVQRPG